MNMNANRHTAPHITRFFRNARGDIVVWQLPNVPLLGWFIFALAAHIASGHHLHAAFSFVSSAFLCVWAYLELVQGASYFRRFLGLSVLLAILVSHLN